MHLFLQHQLFFNNLVILYVALIGYGIVGKISTNPVLIAVVADNAPKNALGTSFSVYHFIGMTASILAPYMTGFLTDVTGSMAIGFLYRRILTTHRFYSIIIAQRERENQ
nr:hypothetical protein [Staphylococcus cornubiensis]